jgi:hypothetical protein
MISISIVRLMVIVISLLLIGGITTYLVIRSRRSKGKDKNNQLPRPSPPGPSPPGPSPPEPSPPEPSPPEPPPPGPPVKNCAVVGEVGDKCCDGLAVTWDGNCANSFDCTGDVDTISKRNECMKHKSGAPCEADPECVVQNVGMESPGGYGGYICVGKRYGSGGLGIYPENRVDTQKYVECTMKLAKLAFPGSSDGCSSAWPRSIPRQSGKNGIINCCTVGIDKGCPT